MALVDFLKDFVTLRGGVVESNHRSVSLLAPADLNLPELATFSLTSEPDQAAEEMLHLGHPYLEEALKEVRARPVVSHRHFQRPLPKSDLPTRLGKSLNFRNAHPSGFSVSATVSAWVFLHCRVTYLWDDKREELRTIGVDLQNGCQVDYAQLRKVWIELGALESQRTLPTELRSRAAYYLQQAISHRLAQIERDSRRYLEVETARMESYYDGLLADLKRRSNAQDKIERTMEEQTLKRQDLEKRSQVKLQVQVIALEMVDIPRQLVEVELSHRKHKSRHRFSYNPLTQDFDPVCCQGCWSATRAIWLCEKGHVLCPNCYAPCKGCQTVACHVCLKGSLNPQGPPTKPNQCASCAQKPVTQKSSNVTTKATQAPQVQQAKSVAKTPPQKSTQPLLADVLRLYLKPLLHPEDWRFVEPIQEDFQNGRLEVARQRLEVYARDVKVSQRFEVKSGHPLPAQELELARRLQLLLKCFESKRSDKIKEALLDLVKTKRVDQNRSKPPVATDSVPESAVSKSLQRVLGKNAPTEILNQLKVHAHYHLDKLHTIYGNDSDLMAACLVYCHSTNTQAQIARAFRVSASKISKFYRYINVRLADDR